MSLSASGIDPALSKFMHEKILLVDSDRCSLRNIGSFLRTEGYEVDEASNGNEAARLLDEEGFDLVLSDVIMPGLSGFHLIERARSVASEIPVLLMSGFPGIDYDYVTQRGATDFIMKPLEFDELLSKVKRSLKLRSHT
jgi:DNA-binding NtrC family response regulator